MLIADTDYRVRDLSQNSNGEEWSEEKEARRRHLIDKAIAGTTTVDERAELAMLDRQGNEHYDRIAPRPLEGARRLHQQLLEKRGSQ